jgi:transposase
MYPVALRDEIRTWVLMQGKSQRAAARHFGLSRNTVAKLLEEEPAPKERRYQRQKVTPKTPVRDVALRHIAGWLKENEWLQRWAPKQLWTAHRMWVELCKLGIPIGESTVRLFVQELRKPMKPAYVPLDFAPGERAEFDFGEATVKLEGRLVKVPFLAGRLRFSGAMFAECFPTQRQEAFLLGQRHAFEFWGGVPRMAVYDNLQPAVLQVLQGHSRREHDVFLHFHSVYRFEALFANVHAGWEKGSVENLVGYARRNYLVPLPEGTDLSSSTLTCAPSVSRISSASWPDGLIRSPRASRLNAPIWDRCHRIHLRWVRWWKCWSIRRGGCAFRPTTTRCPSSMPTNA